MDERSLLSNLASCGNVKGEEAVNRRVVEETTRLERLKDRRTEVPGFTGFLWIVRAAMCLLLHPGQSGKFIDTPSPKESSGQDVG